MKTSGLLDVDLAEAQCCRRHKRSGFVVKALLTCTVAYGLYTATSTGHLQPSEANPVAVEAFLAHSSSPLSSKEVEQLYTSVPDPASARAASRRYATRPHVAGSPGDFVAATDLLKLFQEEFGIAPPTEQPIFSAGSVASRAATLGIGSLTQPNAWIDTYYPLMNTPLHRSLSILDEHRIPIWEAELEEDGDPRDPDAAKHKDAVPAFHGFSADGEVEGQLIYVNYGLKEDYDKVLAAGGNFTGKIALARYGGNFRGLKVQAAEQLGAVGVIMYSDPRDDGAVTVDNGYEPYPAGPARNPHSLQRGSVQFISLYPGDPTTPGTPAYPNATRTEGANIPKIPSLPISWANAQKLLREISGKGLEDAFELDGKASRRSVRLVNQVHNRIMPIWNTMAVIPGRIRDETVILGNHRDAWVMGAVDPTSGTVTMHEVVRGFGTLLKEGWKPLRNIVFASWDAEEYGMIGSTEWTEDFPDWISGNVVAYINIDGSAGGSPWLPTGSPSLAHLIRDAALNLPHPTDSGRSLWDARHDVGPFHGRTSGELFEKIRDAVEDDVDIAPLGSGSDFTSFLQRLGVASMDESFNLSPTDAAYHYHSIYDTEMWKERYADPGFEKHVTVAKHLGLVLLRLIDSSILPLNTTHYSLELERYLNRVEKTANSLGYSVDLSELRDSIRRLQTASRALDNEKASAKCALDEILRKLPSRLTPHRPITHWLRSLLAYFGSLSLRHDLEEAVKRIQQANTKLIGFERGFISEEGLEGREWYKHLGVAPGKWLGYGATTLPAVTEALTIEQNVTLAEKEALRLASLIDRLTQTLSS
ncbi:Zn-dependent exopeptidase [Trametes coccinea BRFM310]|uniref:Zn-dependent exopeptidase n=1 Tax=Trametes coccinea (strain BRFM310) TaxID=1353009 RepID=A0A1Y2IVL4_TRAC3|nr:Zn-dependent exopeptidase [Trametes coccinea BRFM310]